MTEWYKQLFYENRLNCTGLIKLEKRRARGDLIQVFKIIIGIDKVDYRDFFEIVNSDRTSGHILKLFKVGCKYEIRKNFFSQRVVNVWNGLSQEVVDAITVNSFKNRLDKFEKYFREGNQNCLKVGKTGCLQAVYSLLNQDK